MSALLWVRNDGAPGAGRLLSYGSTNCGPDRWSLTAAAGAGAATATVQGTTGTVTGATVPAAQLWDGDWHAVAITYSAAAGLRTYLDGREIGTAAAGKGAIDHQPLPFNGSRSGFRVGALTMCGDDTAPVVDVDEARFYDSALSESDGKYLTNRFHVVAPDGRDRPRHEIAARYPLNQTLDTNQMPDESGHGAHGRLGSGTVEAGGRFGFGLTLAAPGDGFDIRSSVFEPEQATVIAWVKRGSAPLNAGIAGVGSDASCQSIYGLETDATGGVRFRLAGTNGAGTQHSTFLTPTAPAASVWDGQWHAVAGGVPRHRDHPVARRRVRRCGPGPGDRDEIDYGLATNGRGFHVGRGVGTCNANGFAGMVDEVSVYRRGLADAEVSHLTTSDGGSTPPTLPPPEPPAPAEPEPGLVAQVAPRQGHGPSVDRDFRERFRRHHDPRQPVEPGALQGRHHVMAPAAAGRPPASAARARQAPARQRHHRGVGPLDGARQPGCDRRQRQLGRLPAGRLRAAGRRHGAVRAARRRTGWRIAGGRPGCRTASGT